MRIQETDRILKESRYARHGAHAHERAGVITRTWRKLVGFFKRG